MANDAFSVDWMQGWTELQRKIWNDWVAMAGENLQTNRGFPSFPGIPGIPGMEGGAQWPMQWLQQAMEAANSSGSMGSAPWSKPWFQQSAAASPLEDWMRSFGVYAPEATPEQAAMANMMTAANGFVRLGKEIFQVLQKVGETAQDGGDWTKALDRSIQQAKDLFTGQGGEKAALDPMAAWGQPLQMWMGMLKDNPLFSSSQLQNLMSSVKPDGWPNAAGEEWLHKMLGMPGLGLNREKQEQMQAGMRDMMVYQKAFQTFQTLSNQVNVQALERLHKRLLERGATNTPIEKMYDLYVLWVDCCEEVNADFVRGSAFQQANSEMVNALVRVQSHVQTSLDETLAALNMPTRREINASHRQVHDLKRRVRVLEEEIKGLRALDHSAELSALRDDMDRLDVRHLRQELSDMKTLLEVARPHAPDQQEKKQATAARVRVAAREKSGSAPAVTAKRGE